MLDYVLKNPLPCSLAHLQRPLSSLELVRWKTGIDIKSFMRLRARGELPVLFIQVW